MQLQPLLTTLNKLYAKYNSWLHLLTTQQSFTTKKLSKTKAAKNLHSTKYITLTIISSALDLNIRSKVKT